MQSETAPKMERFLARFALLVGTLHGIGEGIWEWFFAQSLAMLLVDYIAVGLLYFGAICYLRRPGTASLGLLAGAWGFTCCLLYRVFFARFDDFMAKGALRDGEPDWFLILLCLEFSAIAVAFAATLYCVHRRRSAE